MLLLATRALAAIIVACLATGATLAQSFPERDVRIVVPFPPGGGSDILARTIADKLSAQWKQSVIVENLAGAGGAVGTAAVAKAPPDGHTLLIADASVFTTNPLLYPSLSYAAKDLAPVINLATFGLILVAPANSPIQSLRDLLAMDKAKAARLNVASSGNGTGNHLALEKFNEAAGLGMAHVPYKGAGPALNDVLGAQVDLMFSSGPLVVPHLKTSRIRALAVTSKSRMGLAPDVPTVAESGVAGFEAVAAQGVFAPAATPRNVIARINSDIAAVLAHPDVKARWAQMGLDPLDNSPEQFASWLAQESVSIAALIKKKNITPN